MSSHFSLLSGGVPSEATLANGEAELGAAKEACALYIDSEAQVRTNVRVGTFQFHYLP